MTHVSRGGRFRSFTAGSLQLVKSATGDLADAYGAGPFTLRVSCLLSDDTGVRVVHEDTVVLGGDQPLEATIDDIATGAVCLVTEPDAGGASDTTIRPILPVTIGDEEQTVTVTVTNSFDPATVLIDKVVTGDAADFAADSFDVEATEIETLAGSTCTAVETDTGAATAVTYDPPNPDDPNSSGPVDTDADEPVTVTVTNEYRAGGLQIAKQIDGPGVPLDTGPFVFDVTCAFNGDPAAYTQTVTLVRTGDENPLTSEVITPLPVGAVCTVTETDSAGADSTPPPVVVTIPDVDDAGNAQVVVARLVNPLSAAQLQVTKVLTGDAAAAHAGEGFVVAVTCQADVDGTRLTLYSGSVLVSGGQTTVVSDAAGNPVLLPPGARCFGVETQNGGASESTVDYDSFDNAVIAEAGDQLQTLTITATNRFDGGKLPNTGVPVWRQLTWMLLLLGAGIAMVLASRVRRRSADSAS